jgi:hypothetical protein
VIPARTNHAPQLAPHAVFTCSDKVSEYTGLLFVFYSACRHSRGGCPRRRAGLADRKLRFCFCFCFSRPNFIENYYIGAPDPMRVSDRQNVTSRGRSDLPPSRSYSLVAPSLPPQKLSVLAKTTAALRDLGQGPAITARYCFLSTAHPEKGADLCSCGFDLSFDDDRQRERKCRALTKLRLNPDLPPVHLNDALRYGEPQAGAALLARDRVVGLLELLKQLAAEMPGPVSRTET